MSQDIPRKETMRQPDECSEEAMSQGEPFIKKKKPMSQEQEQTPMSQGQAKQFELEGKIETNLSSSKCEPIHKFSKFVSCCFF